MTQEELSRVLNEHWMSLPEEERFLTGGRLYEAEKALLERLAPADYSRGERMEFVYYHIHGYQVPEEAARQFQRRASTNRDD